jgi:hypothetical protein
MKTNKDTIFNYIKGDKRLEDEPFEQYKLRLKYEQFLMKFYRRYGAIPLTLNE